MQPQSEQASTLATLAQLSRAASQPRVHLRSYAAALGRFPSPGRICIWTRTLYPVRISTCLVTSAKSSYLVLCQDAVQCVAASRCCYLPAGNSCF